MVERFISLSVQQSMRLVFTLLLIIIYQAAFCQSTGRPETTSATPIPSVAQNAAITASKEYRLLINDISNADAWLNYYKWIGNSDVLSPIEKKQVSAETILSSKQYIAASWQYALMNFIQSGKRNKSFLDAAIASSDNKAMLYPYAIHFAVITANQELLKEYATALNDAAPLSTVLYEYHFNALMSAEKNAVIYAKGLTDIAPMAVLQQVYGIRSDVTFRYYEQKITDTANVYICLSAGKDIISSYPAATYSGLLISLSANASSKEMLQRPAGFTLEKLRQLHVLEQDEKGFYKNYLPSFILLYKSYVLNNDATAGEWKSIIQKLGRLTGTSASVNKMLSE